MAVARDDDIEPGCFRLQIELRQIMQHIDGDSANLDDFCLRQLAGPGLFVDIAADRSHGRNSRKLIKNLGSAHIACMDDVFRAAQRYKSLGAKQAVGIGNDADEDGSSQFSVSISRGDFDFIFSANLPTLTTARPTVPRPISCASSRALTRKV